MMLSFLQQRRVDHPLIAFQELQSHRVVVVVESLEQRPHIGIERTNPLWRARRRRARARDNLGPVADNASMTPLPPGSVVRFRVVDDGRYGSSWSVQTAQATGDVYVAHREGGRWIHTSLHHDGRWHFAVTAAGQAPLPGSPRYLGVSTEHEEFAPGWLHAMRITVAKTELRSGWREAAKQRQLVEVPLPLDFQAVSLDVLLGTSAAAPIRIDSAFLVSNLLRGDGGTAAIVARPTHLDAPVHEAFAPQIAVAVAELRQHGWDGRTTTRLVIFGGDDDAYLREVEVAVDPDRGE